MSKLEDIEITQSAEERRKALMTAWEWGWDAAMDWRDRMLGYRVWNGPAPEPQSNPWRVEIND